MGQIQMQIRGESGSDFSAIQHRYALNINEVANRDVMSLKERKDSVLSQKLRIEEKLQRVRRNINNSKHLKSRNLESLQEFFPDVKSERIANIEEFHGKVAVLLKRQLAIEEVELSEQAQLLHTEQAELDRAISEKLASVENPSAIVDRIYELSGQWQKSKGENDYYRRHESLVKEIRSIKDEIRSLKDEALFKIEEMVNVEIRSIVKTIYGESRQSPTLDLKDGNYTYHVFEDTGTGKAYSNLIVFDLAIFALTNLSIIIHDSLLFKNVENSAVAGMIGEYVKNVKQSFIAIDEIAKYGSIAEDQLRKFKVIELSNTNVLYILDWRRKNS